MGDSDGWKRGQKGFGTDKGFDVKTTVGEGKKLYSEIWPVGKTANGKNGGEPTITPKVKS